MALGRRRRRVERPKAQIDMNSLIDLTFLLLVTFIVTLPALEQGVNLEIDCTDLNYMASSGLRVFQSTIRTVVRGLGGQIKLTHVNDDIFDILKMTVFTRHITVERAQ